MFENIGKKIKSLAEFICYIGMVLYVAIGFALFIKAVQIEDGNLAIIALVILIIGLLASWIGSFFMYGFGELIDNTQKIKEVLQDNKKQKNFNNEYYQNINYKNLKINEIDEHATIGSCEICGREVVVLRQCEMDNNFEKVSKKLCENCIDKIQRNL